MIIPPPIGRFYFLDLRPGRSFVEYAISQGIQVFLLSWRNPTRRAGRAGTSTPTPPRVLSAIDVVREISGSDDVNLMGFCAGGIISTTLLNHLAATGDDRVHSMSLRRHAARLRRARPDRGVPAPGLLRFARRTLAPVGHHHRRQMGAAFTWMRPDDLVFNYWVNNYLMGDEPPAFDILAWNADGTNLPGALHAQFLDIFEEQPAHQARAALSVLGTPVRPRARSRCRRSSPARVVDHLTPWTGLLPHHPAARRRRARSC